MYSSRGPPSRVTTGAPYAAATSEPVRDQLESAAPTPCLAGSGAEISQVLSALHALASSQKSSGNTPAPESSTSPASRRADTAVEIVEGARPNLGAAFVGDRASPGWEHSQYATLAPLRPRIGSLVEARVGGCSVPGTSMSTRTPGAWRWSRPWRSSHDHLVRVRMSRASAVIRSATTRTAEPVGPAGRETMSSRARCPVHYLRPAYERCDRCTRCRRAAAWPLAERSARRLKASCSRGHPLR